MTIWSWDLDQPPDEIMRDRNRRCGAMKSNGRWVVQDCNDKLPVACRKIGTSSQVLFIYPFFFLCYVYLVNGEL